MHTESVDPFDRDLWARKAAALSGMAELMVSLLYRPGRPSAKGREDVTSRDLVCTPFDGHYGQAGWVLCVNGSPPRGTLLILKDAFITIPVPVFYITLDGCRRLRGREDLATVREFAALFLDGETAPFSLGSLPADCRR
jgi:hypothetical protein